MHDRVRPGARVFARRCGDTIPPTIRKWSGRMVMACVSAAVLFLVVAVTSAASGYLRGYRAEVLAFIAGGGLGLVAWTLRLFSVAAPDTLQLFELAVADSRTDKG